MKGVHISPLKAIWKQCTGEAHRNPFIDHCPVCAPHWGSYPTCPVCGARLVQTDTGKLICRNHTPNEGKA